MTDRALVIGIDSYSNPAWELRAAVRDALKFANWVTAPNAGRATAETLTLLLSPHADRPVKEPFELATEASIRRALFAHRKNGASAERLWFFYAGHGIAPAGGAPDEAPVVVPADVEDLDFYRSNPIDLGSWIREMQVSPPEYQLFFVDACRGIVVDEDVVTATKTLFFDLSKVKPGGQARQAVLFATTAGQLANEYGLHGLFGGAVNEGLLGRGPALEPDLETEEFVLTFGALTAYAKRRIQLHSEEARRGNQTLPTQEPAESLFRCQSSLPLARFKEKPSSLVKVYVEPALATMRGTAGIRGYNEWKKAWERQAEHGSPLDVPIEWELSSSVYKIEIEADGFENWSKKVEVVGPVELHADLVATPARVSKQVDFALEAFPSTFSGLEVQAPDGAELAAGKHGALVVRTMDRYSRIEVFDATGARVEAGWGQLSQVLPVGTYRVEIALPTERPIVKSVLVTADEPETIDVSPDPQLTERLPPSAAIIRPNGGLSEPSEAFGWATTTHLGSLLAWAASAAQFDESGNGQRLRLLGIEPVAVTPGQCAVRVLVGDARPPGSSPQSGPIETLLLEMHAQTELPSPVPGLPGFAVQWHGPVLYDTSLTISTGGLSPKRIPLPLVADHVWTIVVVRESTHRTEIHRYLQRAASPLPFDDTIRLVEQSFRALESRTPLYDDELARLLERDLDPLALAVLGYRLALETRWSDLHLVLERLAPFHLADKHVLKALVAGGDASMQLAIQSSSVPVVGEGYRLMEAWVVEHFAARNLPPPVAPEPFTGGLWTTFDTRGKAVVSKAFPASNPPAWAKPLLSAAHATARLESGAGSENPVVGTGFLVAPQFLATASHVLRPHPERAIFDHFPAMIEDVMSSNDELDTALIRIATTERAPLKLRKTPPEVGTRIAVIGHPRFTFTPTIVTLAAFTTPPTGEKMIMPGVIVAVEGTELTYECWTMAGVSGGPILDLATGEVIGIHQRARYKGGGKMLGFGVSSRAIEEMLQLAGIPHG